jgi:hypothetical protein
VVNAVQGKIAVCCGTYKKQIHTICGLNAADLTVTKEGLNWSINHLSLVDTSCNTRLKVKTVCFLPPGLFMCFLWILEEAVAPLYLILTDSLLITEASLFLVWYELTLYISFRFICVFSVLIGKIRILNTCKIFWYLERVKQEYWTL